MRLLTLIVVLSIPLLLSACNTAKGIGEDINGAGRAITNGAQDVQKKL